MKLSSRVTRRCAAWVLGLGVLALAGCASAPAGCAEGGPAVVCTTQGAVRGAVENGMLAFKGIPYAAAPVGALRWQPPAPAQPWQGVRDGSRFGAICPQLDGTEVAGDEDCLTLNVWGPAAPANTPRPVMVFFPGGGNHSYSGQGAAGFGGVRYDGGQMVPQGALFVSFNYRLGALGFLAHPALTAERADRVSGNYGSQDQIAMLRWLHENIAAFGGDPHQVFLFGTSAGGGNLCALMTAPAARGLFHRVAMQSSVPTGCELPRLADMEQGTGQRVAQALGCGADMACLRGKSVADIVRALPGSFGVLPRLYGPVVDGQVFPDQPLALIQRGAHQAMPVIIGNDTQETMQFVNAVGPVTDAASYAAAVGKTFGPEPVQRILAAYPVGAYPTPRQALVQLTTDALFTCQSRRVARSLAAHQQPPVYRYLFDHALLNDPQHKALGAVHTVEHMFLFPWQGSYRPTADDLAVQKLMVGAWARLAREGTLQGGPSGWPQAQPGDAYLLIAPQPAVRRGDDLAHCDFWDSVRLPWPHL